MERLHVRERLLPKEIWKTNGSIFSINFLFLSHSILYGTNPNKIIWGGTPSRNTPKPNTTLIL